MIADPTRDPQSSTGALCQKLLSPDQPVLDFDSIRAMNCASGAVAATNGANFLRQMLEVILCLMKISSEVVIGQIAYQHPALWRID